MRPASSGESRGAGEDGPHAQANPYVQRDAAIDLDAAGPVLHSHDGQRVNRKALAFLGGIVALLAAAALWMLQGAAPDADAASAVRKEAVVIPQLPASATPSPASVPLPVEAAPVSAALPPLPDEPIPVAQAAPAFPAAASPPPVHVPTLLERRMDNADARGAPLPSSPYAQAFLAAMPQPPGRAPADPPATPAGPGAQFIAHPDALLVRGTYIRCVLETRIVTDIPGYTSCVVTEPTYSINGRSLLLPKGSKLSGRYDIDANGPRIAVVWDRITTPNGFDVSMASPGVDNLGGAGHPGDYDAHWASRVGAALMISMISDVFKYEGEQHGPRTTTVGNGLVTQAPFESNTARTMERLANQALDRSISRPATVTIAQGTLLNVYVAKDVDFSGVLAQP
jgi:type IV secretion system protein VirB10